MLLHWKPLIIVFLLSICTLGYLQAQEPVTPATPESTTTRPAPPVPGKGRNDEHIIIHRKGSAGEKLTIVVDGDNITVNGQPLAAFKNDSIDIRSMKTGRLDFAPRAPRAPRADGAMRLEPPRAFPVPGELRELSGTGTVRSNRGFTEAFRGAPNAAFLGIATAKSDKGAIVKEVTKESPAEKAGLQKNDIITKIGDSIIYNSERLYEVVGKYKPEDKVKITYLRDGKEKTTKATLEKNENSFAFSYNKSFQFKAPEMGEFHFSPDDLRNGGGWTPQPRLGLQLKDTEDGNGAQVLEAREDAPATKAGIQKEDVITGINGVAVHSVDEIRDQLKLLKDGDTVKIEFSRNNKSQSAEVKFPKKLKTSNL